MVRSLTTMQCCCCEGAYFLTPNHDPNKVSSASLERVKESKRRRKLNKTAEGGKRAQHKGADRIQTTVPRLIRLLVPPVHSQPANAHSAHL